MEILLGCGDFDALTAERYGYINRAVSDEELDDFVSNLAQRISSFPGEAIRRTKSIVNAVEGISEPDYGREWLQFYEVSRTPAAVDLMNRAMSLGLQTPDIEREDLEPFLSRLNGSD